MVNWNNSTYWYVKRGDHKIGPFSYTEIVRQMQEKALFASDLVSLKHLDSQQQEHWEKISECHAFKPENIRKLLTSSDPVAHQIFFKRLPRVPYRADVIVHMNKNSYEGHSAELSANGAGLLILDGSHGLHLGLNIFLYFKVSDEVPKFNAIGTIVNRHTFETKANEAVYGIRFVNISKDIRDAIKAFTENSVLENGVPKMNRRAG